jgi:hypothetical protein
MKRAPTEKPLEKSDQNKIPRAALVIATAAGLMVAGTFFVLSSTPVAAPLQFPDLPQALESGADGGLDVAEHGASAVAGIGHPNHPGHLGNPVARSHRPGVLRDCIFAIPAAVNGQDPGAMVMNPGTPTQSKSAGTDSTERDIQLVLRRRSVAQIPDHRRRQLIAGDSRASSRSQLGSGEEADAYSSRSQRPSGFRRRARSAAGSEHQHREAETFGVLDQAQPRRSVMRRDHDQVPVRRQAHQVQDAAAANAHRTGASRWFKKVDLRSDG